MTAPVPAVKATDLTLRYWSRSQANRGVTVDGASFEVAAGEVLAIVGETGSGKSTLARAIALEADLSVEGSPAITGGSLQVLGREVRGISARMRDRLSLYVGYLPQEAGDRLAPRLTVAENVAEPIFSRDRDFDQLDAGEAVATLIDAVHLPLSSMSKYPHELSKGQRQRVAIARAMILEPRLLVADDPTAGIDVTVRSSILDVLSALQAERGFSAVIVTADLAEVRRVSNRVAVMQRGVIVGIGEVADVLDDPSHEYVVGLAEALELAATLTPLRGGGDG